MNKPIGSFSPESPLLEQLKDLIATQATAISLGCGCEDVLNVYINAYHFAKEAGL